MDNSDKLVSPSGLDWIRDKGLIGTTTFSQLQPWCCLEEYFCVNDKWPDGPATDKLIAFARRQDNDDIACYTGSNDSQRVVVIHGWTGDSYLILREYESFWNWLKDVIEDIAEWSRQSEIK